MSEEKQSVVGAPTQPTGGDEALDIDKVVEDLGEEMAEEEETEESSFKTEKPIQEIDINSLSLEQLQQLQARLAATPHPSQTEAKKTIVKVRMINGGYVVDFDRAYIALIDDPENNRKVERHVIPVKLHNQDEKVHVPYRQFLQSEQVDCEVTDTRKRDNPVKRGTTYNEHGELVDMMVNRVEHYFTLKTPDGETLEIEGKVANA